MRYGLDINILLHYLRETDLSVWVDNQFNPLDSTINEAILCVVSIGEINHLQKSTIGGKGDLIK